MVVLGYLTVRAEAVPVVLVGELVVLAILIAFPALALWLPEQMK